MWEPTTAGLQGGNDRVALSTAWVFLPVCFLSLSQKLLHNNQDFATVWLQGAYLQASEWAFKKPRQGVRTISLERERAWDQRSLSPAPGCILTPRNLEIERNRRHRHYPRFNLSGLCCHSPNFSSDVSKTRLLCLFNSIASSRVSASSESKFNSIYIVKTVCVSHCFPHVLQEQSFTEFNSEYVVQISATPHHLYSCSS